MAILKLYNGHTINAIPNYLRNTFIAITYQSGAFEWENVNLSYDYLILF